MLRLFVFGLGYSGRCIAAAAAAIGAAVTGTTRAGSGATLRFGDRDRIEAALRTATHIVSTVPPDAAGDPVLAGYGDAVARSGAWCGYLSSTGVYGDAAGAWVDETAPLTGRRPARIAADAAWLSEGARVFRLPGIYGPGRSALDRVSGGDAYRIGLAGQVFSRIHVDDLARGVVAGFGGPPGAYNLADDEPASYDDVVTFAASLLGMPPPPCRAIETVSPGMRAFFAENRRVANGKARRLLGWAPRFPDYRAGLRAVSATTSPDPASTAPPIASGVQR